MSFVTRRVLISNTVFVGLGAIVADLITLLILPRFVKNLGADLYGLWIISKIILGYFNLLDFGFTEGLTRYVAEARVKEAHDRLSSSVMSGLGLLSALGLLIGLMVIAFRGDIVGFLEVGAARREVAEGLLFVTGLFSIVLWPQRITRVILRACLRMSEQSLLDTATALASSVVLLVLVTQSVDIVTLAVVEGVVRVVLWIPSVVLVVRYVPQMRWQWRLFSFARIREMSSFSLGMFYSALLTMLTVRVSNLVIAKMLSVTAVTSYAVASRLYAFLVQATQVTCATIVPAVYNLTAADDKDRLSRLVYQAVKYRAMMNVAVAYLCIAIAPSFIRTWMGPAYDACGPWAQIFLIQHLLVPLGVMSNVLKGMGRVGVVNLCTTARVVVSLALGIALVPRYGIGGPIVGTVVGSFILGDLVFFPHFCRVAGLEWRRPFFLYLRILLVNLILGVPAFAVLQLHPLTTWPALGGVSAVMLLLAVGLNYLVFFERQEKEDVRLVAETLGLMRLRGWARGERRMTGATPASRAHLMEWLRKQETDHPVETWQYGHWHVWPYLRVTLALRARYGRMERRSSVMARMGRPLRMLKRLVQIAGFRRTPAHGGGAEDTRRYRVVALTHARRPVAVDGKVVSPFVGVLMDRLRAWQIPAISVEAYCERDLRRIPRPYNYCLWEDIQPTMHLPLMKERLPWAGAFRNMERELGVEPAFLQRLQVIGQRAEFWKEYFRSHGTELLFVTCWYDAPVVMPAVLAARQLGIPAVDIQHGFQDRNHEAYGGWTKAPPGGYELMPDFFWCWSRERCRESQDANPGLRNAVRYVAGGDLWLNHNARALTHTDSQLYEKAARRCASFARTILVCPCGNSLQHGVYPRLKSAIDKSPGNWNWLIRLHHADRKDRRTIESALGAADLRRRLDLDCANVLSLYECISLCDVMVSDLSTCAQEGLAFGKPCVIIGSNGRDAYARPIAEGSMICADGEGIAEALSRAVSIAPDVCRRSAEYFFASPAQSDRAVAEFLQCTLEPQWEAADGGPGPARALTSVHERESRYGE